MPSRQLNRHRERSPSRPAAIPASTASIEASATCATPNKGRRPQPIAAKCDRPAPYGRDHEIGDAGAQQGAAADGHERLPKVYQRRGQARPEQPHQPADRRDALLLRDTLRAGV